MEVGKLPGVLHYKYQSLLAGAGGGKGRLAGLSLYNKNQGGNKYLVLFRYSDLFYQRTRARFYLEDIDKEFL